MLHSNFLHYARSVKIKLLTTSYWVIQVKCLSLQLSFPFFFDWCTIRKHDYFLRVYWRTLKQQWPKLICTEPLRSIAAFKCYANILPYFSLVWQVSIILIQPFSQKLSSLSSTWRGSRVLIIKNRSGGLSGSKQFYWMSWRIIKREMFE